MSLINQAYLRFENSGLAFASVPPPSEVPGTVWQLTLELAVAPRFPNPFQKLIVVDCKRNKHKLEILVWENKKALHKSLLLQLFRVHTFRHVHKLLGKFFSGKLALNHPCAVLGCLLGTSEVAKEEGLQPIPLIGGCGQGVVRWNCDFNTLTNHDLEIK